MPEFPADFVASMQQQLGEDWNDFVATFAQDRPVSIHLNLAKPGLDISGTPIPWNPNGRYLLERPSFTTDPHFQAGRYYVQEAGSMFLAYVIAALQQKRTLHTVLDLCGAPGGKTTLLLNHLPQHTVVVSNEVIKSRFAILRHNLAKWGRANVIATQADPKHFAACTGLFDLLVVDAPCSGEGLFRKTREAMQEWSTGSVQLCQSRQRRILHDAWPLVSGDGFLVYSTCTYNELENDGNVQWLCEEAGFDVVDLDVPSDWNIVRTHYGYQFYPHRTQSEGFYLAVLQKTTETKSSKRNKMLRHPYYQPAGKQVQTVGQSWLRDKTELHILQDPKGQLYSIHPASESFLPSLYGLKRYVPGTPLGQVKGQGVVPDHTLALSIHLSDQILRWEVDEKQALSFLRKEPLHRAEAPASQGWHLITYDGWGLGWVKLLPNRVNNYLPKTWRVLC